MRYRLVQLINEAATALKLTPEHWRQARGNSMNMVVKFPVQKFLRMTTSDERNVDFIKRHCQTVSKYNEYAERGENLHMPMLWIDGNKIAGHEGRHRAAALMCAGARYMPVAIHIRPNEATRAKYGHFEAKYEAKYEDLPPIILGQFGRGSIAAKDLEVIRNGRDNLHP